MLYSGLIASGRWLLTSNNISPPPPPTPVPQGPGTDTASLRDNGWWPMAISQQQRVPPPAPLLQPDVGSCWITVKNEKKKRREFECKCRRFLFLGRCRCRFRCLRRPCLVDGILRRLLELTEISAKLRVERGIDRHQADETHTGGGDGGEREGRAGVGVHGRDRGKEEEREAFRPFRIVTSLSRTGSGSRMM